jgi:DNA-binding MarR family transcriptional regulator
VRAQAARRGSDLHDVLSSATLVVVKSMAGVPTPHLARRADVAAFELLTRSLVGITLQSLRSLDGAVSMPQFRLLLMLDELGRVPSSRLAAALGLGAPAVTRLADRLAADGLLERGTDPRSRAIVTVEVTPAGRALVNRVLNRRHELFASVLDAMTPAERDGAAAAARRFAELATDAAGLGVTGPLPL